MKVKLTVNDKAKKFYSDEDEVDLKKLLTILFCIIGFAEIVLCILKFLNVFDISTFSNYTVVLCCYEAELMLGIVFCTFKRNKKNYHKHSIKDRLQK